MDEVKHFVQLGGAAAYRWRIQNFERGRQFISSVLIYRKSAQQNIYLFYAEKTAFRKNMSQ